MIKNLIIRKIIPTTTVLVLAGQNMDINTLSRVDVPVYFDGIDQNGVFFQKGLEQKITLDDVILNSQERGIIECNGVLEEELKWNLEYSIYSDSYDYIEDLHVHEFAKDIYTSDGITNRIEEHQNSNLYVSATNDLNWNLLFSVLKENNQKREKEYYEELEKITDIDEREWYAESNHFEAFTDEDLKLWISQLHAFTDFVHSKVVPNLDMERLACVLQDYTVGYQDESMYNEFVFASTNWKGMTYPLPNALYPNLEAMQQTNWHEFIHLLCVPCKDEQQNKYVSYGSSIFLGTNKSRDYRYYIPFQFLMYEEALAEKYSSDFLGEEPDTYPDNRFVLDNLTFSLIFQPGFMQENFVKASILHNPIAFIQQFPMLSNHDSLQNKWLESQLNMLECYNVVNHPTRLVFYHLKYDSMDASNEEIVNKSVMALENYADLQMTRNFIWNLNNLKEARPELTKEDCCYLMNLYQERLKTQRDAVCTNFSIPTLDTIEYLNLQAQLDTIFKNWMEENFKTTSVYPHQLTDVFSEEEINYFEYLKEEMNQYQSQIKTSISLEEMEQSIKKYYKTPEIK